jgi:hypothetical protein
VKERTDRNRRFDVTCKQPGRLHGEFRSQTFLIVARNPASDIISARPSAKYLPLLLCRQHQVLQRAHKKPI